MKRDGIQVVMLPWLAFGHMPPFFQLSIALAKEGVHVSFISTPKNIMRLPKVPNYLAPLVNLVEFPLPKLDDRSLLPDDAEATVDIPHEKVIYLKEAYDLLQDPIKRFITRERPDWIIVDFNADWIVDVGRDLDIPLINFSVFTTAIRVFFGPGPSPGQEGIPKSLHELLVTPPHWVDFPSSIAYCKHEAMQVATYETLLGHDDSRLDDACSFVAIRSCTEVEGDYLEAHKRIYRKPVIPVGLLPPEELPVDERTLVDHPDWQKISKWLDRQKPKSVVFVGFGSECKLSKDQLYEIANGVQLSGLPFLWILQKPNWAWNDEIDVFPSGFGEATEGRGLVHIGWAPQKEILAHSSIGGSLFHAGWGSTIETLQHGHVLVVLPFIFDQGLNARLLVEKGVAIEVKRNNEDGSFSGNDIAMSLREAMVSDEGEELRARTKKVAAIFRDRNLHDSYVRNFVEYLKSNREMKV